MPGRCFLPDGEICSDVQSGASRLETECAAAFLWKLPHGNDKERGTSRPQNGQQSRDGEEALLRDRRFSASERILGDQTTLK